MDARFLRAARFFVVSLLVAQLSVVPAVGETVLATVDASPRTITKTPAPAVLAPARPVLGTPARPIITRPGSGAPITSPITRGPGGTGSTGVKPRVRPNAQGPQTYAGTASLDFTPTSQYSDYSTTAAGTVTAATGYTYALDFGDGSAETNIPIANGAATYSLAKRYATAGTYTAFVVATNTTAQTTTRLVTQAIVISQLSGNFADATPTTGTATTITFNGNVPAMNAPAAPAITIDFGDGTPTAAATYGANVSVAHTYANAGNYRLIATATVSGAVLATQMISVVDAGGGTTGTLGVSPSAVYLGASVTVAGMGPPPANATVYAISYGDGTTNSNVTAATAYSFAHTYTTAGAFTVELTSTNPATGRTVVEQGTTVNVATPSGTITAASVAPGTPSTIQFQGVIPTSNAPVPPTITIDFGDGTTTTTTYAQNVMLTHTYATANTYTVTATLGTTTLATGFAVDSAATDTLTANPTSIYSGSTAQIAFTAPPFGGIARPPTCVLEFGDGTTQSFTCGSNTLTHAYAATTATTENVRISTQGNAGTTLAATTLTVDPLVGTFTSSSVTQGSASSITFTGRIPAMNPPTPPTVTIAFGDGTTTTTTYGTATLAHTYAQAGTFNLTATVGNATIATGTTTVNPAAANNGTITATPNDVYAGSTVTFTGTAPPFDTGYTFFIAFGDGTNSPNITGGTTYTITHSYAMAGNITATLSELIQASGQTAGLVTAAVTVAPLSGTFSSTTVQQGTPSSITFTGTIPAGNPPAPPTVTIAFGDGTTTTVTYGTAMLAHTYAGTGTFNLTATANGTTIATGTAVVNAATPTGGSIAANPNSVYVGSAVTISGTAPTNANGGYTFSINFGDGTSSANLTAGAAYSVSHTYASAGMETVTLEETNANAAVTAGPAATVSVSPLSGTFTAPSVMLGMPSSVTFAGVVPANPPANAPTVTIAFGDGQTTTVPYGTSTVQHTYATMGTFDLTATANNRTIATGTTTISAAALSISASPAATYSGTATTFTVMYPPAATNAQQCVLNFGDGTSQTFTCAPLTVQHTYNVTSNTTETASVALVNANGGTGTAMTTQVNVVVPTASVSLSSPTIFEGTTENATITTDAIGGVTGPTMTLDWGDGTAPTTGLAFQNQVVSHGYATTRSLGSNHRFAAPGTYTLRLYDAAGTLATLSVTVVTPTAAIAISKANIVPGNTETVTITVGGLNGLNGPPLTVDYGDGSAIVVTYANATLQHTYTRAGNFTIDVSDSNGSLATQAVQVFQPSATISLNPSPVLAGSATTVSVNVTPVGTATGPAPLTLNFGDGTSTTLPSYANATFAHTYAAVGTYSLTLSAPGFGTIGSNVINAVRQNQALLVPPMPVAANAPADIVVNVTPPAGFAVTPLELEFGDGSSIVVQSTGTYPHIYAKPGVYTVTLINTSTGLAIATQLITIEGVTPRVPVGQIYSSSFTNSPVLAGGETNILIQWSAAVPSLGTILDPIEGYVDLLDAKGKLVRRSDPFEIPGEGYAGAGVHTTQIPYDTPVDAHGTYQTRVILRSTQGGTITVGPPATLIIIGGPDPSIKVNAQFHDTGSLEIGPHAGQPGATFDPGMSLGFLSPAYSGAVSGIFDPISRRSDPLITVKSGAQTAISGPDASPAPAAPVAPSALPMPSAQNTTAAGAPGVVMTFATASPAPTPLATPAPGTPPNANYMPGPTPVPDASPVASGAPVVPGPAGPPDQRAFAVPDRAAAYATPSVPVAGPVAATAPPLPATSANPVPHNYTQLGGRGQATLPDALGGGTTLRGLDVNDTLGPVTYQVGYGYTALATASTSAERGAVGDISRTVGSDGLVRVTYFGRQDDPFHYPLASGQTGPLVTDSELLQFSAPTFDGFKIGLSGALSSAHALQVADYRTDDAADKFDLSYTHDSYTAAFNYHNAGPLFAVGSGPGATADRVGGSGALSSPITKFLNLQLNYSTDQARSAFSRQTDAGSTLAFTLPAQSTLSIAVKRDTQVAPDANTRNDSGTAALGTHIGIGTLALNAGVSSAQDLVSSVNDAITRTGSVQYALQANGHSFGFGLNATMVQQSGAAPVPMMTATPDPATIGSPTTTTAPGGVGSSMVTPVTGPGGNAQVGETMTYGFPFGGRVVNGAIVHGLELQLSASNSNAHAQGTGGYDQALSGILSYHLSAHLALGLRTEENWHGDILPANRTKSSAIRLRLDLTQ